MKNKLFLLLAFLCPLFAGSVLAEQQYEGETIVSGKKYYMLNVGSGKFLNGNTPTDKSSASLWTVTLSGKTITLYNPTDGNYLYARKNSKQYSIYYGSNSGTGTITDPATPTGNYGGYAYKIYGTDTHYINVVDAGTSLSSATTASTNNDWLFISQAQMDDVNSSIAYPTQTGWSKLTAMPTNTNDYFYAFYSPDYKWSVALGDGTEQSGNKVMMFSNTVDPQTSTTGLWSLLDNGGMGTNKYNIVNVSNPEYFMQHESSPSYAWRCSDNGGGNTSWGATGFTYADDKWQINSPNDGYYIGPWHYETNGNLIGDEFASNRASGATYYDIWSISRGQYFANTFTTKITNANPIDATYLLNNTKATLRQTLGWTATNSKIESNTDDGYFFTVSIWNSNTEGSIYQTLTDMPKGCYTLKAKVKSANNTPVSLVAGSNSTTATNSAWTEMSVKTICTDGNLNLGAVAKPESGSTYQWSNIDDFTLTYYGNGVVNYAVAKVDAPAADTWYYQEITEAGRYKVVTDGTAKIVYTQDGEDTPDDVTTEAGNGDYVNLSVGKIYYKADAASSVSFVQSFTVSDLAVEFTNGNAAEASKWYKYTTEASSYYITSTSAVTLYYTQKGTDEASTVSTTIDLPANEAISLKLSAGHFYFKSTDATAKLTFDAYDASKPVAGTDYYLYNVYQAKYLGHGNTYDTQASLDVNVMKCTLEAGTGSTFEIKTNYTKDGDSDNYLYVTDKLNVWVDSKTGGNTTAQEWLLTKVDDGYTITYVSDGKTYALMFDQGNVCCVAEIGSDVIKADKAIWKFVSVTDYEAYLAKKRFTVAALNVDGMPKEIDLTVTTISLNPDAKEEAGATAIGQKMKTMGWDAIGMSEDFNFHSNIWDEAWNSGTDDATKGIYSYNATTHLGGITVGNANLTNYFSKKPLFETDGLCLFYKCSNVDQTTLEDSETRTAWNEHYGYTDDGADGLITKGYRYYTMKLEDNTEIDLYIMHMDAETRAGDLAARESQLTQLADAIKASTNGRPIIVMGDTNCRYTRDKVKSLFIDAINSDSRFTVKDPWIEFGRSNVYPAYGRDALMVDELGYRKGEVVDKIFYINNTKSSIRIKPLRFRRDLSFIDSEGEPLADHWPAVCEFEYGNASEIEEEEESIAGTYYLRNVATGKYLKAGGWWGTHAVVGDYGTAMTLGLSDGEYTLSSSFGNLYNSDGPYMDGTSTIYWKATQIGNYYVFHSDEIKSGQNLALSVTDTECKYGPNKQMVEFETYNASDEKQQWQLLTLAEMNELILEGTAANPVNATHLLKTANFDRNDGSNGWTNSITAGASKMSYNLGGDNSGLDNNAQGNRVGEVYVSTDDGTHSTTWDISQSLTGIPNGEYRVSCQGFFAVADNKTSTDSDKKLYATSGSTTVTTTLCYIYNDDVKQTAISGSRSYNGYTYPNTMAEAAAFFNAGYYKNELIIKVTDGTLKIAVAKDEASKTSTVWTCFDNFQLEYLGDILDADQYYLYNVDAGGFLNGGAQAVLNKEEGLLWTVGITDDGYTLKQKTYKNVNNSSEDGSLFSAWNGLYVDNNPTAYDIYDSDEDNIYYITSADRTKFVGWGGDPGNTIVDWRFTSADQEPRGTRWMLMSEDDYSTYKDGLSLAFSARQAAWPIRRAAIMNDIDYSALETVYTKLDATSDEITAATTTLKESIDDAALLATVSSPMDVSYRITNAGCGYSGFTGWTNTNMINNITRFYSNDKVVLAPRFYEEYVSPSSTLASTGSLTQSLTGLPEGYYKLAVDGIAIRQDGNKANVSGCILYAGDQTVTINTPSEEKPQTFTTDAVYVSDGKLEIGVKLENCTANWIAFDNFRLYTYAPEKEIATGKIVTDGDMITVTGIWRSIDKDILNTALKKSYLTVDVKGATINTDAIKVANTESPNVLIYATDAQTSKIKDTNETPITKNLVINKVCTDLQITDKKNFGAPDDDDYKFTASKVSYSRGNTAGYNTVCLPFSFTKSEVDEGLFGSDATVYTYTGMEYADGAPTSLTFSDLEDGKTVDAGTPCLIKNTSSTTWTISDKELTNTAIAPKALKVNGTPYDTNTTDSIYGAFVGKTLGEGYYKLNTTGTKFVQTVAASTITPFRFYMAAGKKGTYQGVREELNIVLFNEETGVRTVLDPSQINGGLYYDLSGRASSQPTQRGIYIKNGKKVLVK